jgi:hypothetical protein
VSNPTDDGVSRAEALAEPPAAAEARPLRPEHVAAVRLGTGANCSSVGSVVDTLFASAAVGAALFAAVLAALQSEPVRVVGSRPGGGDAPPRGPPGDGSDALRNHEDPSA